LKLHPHTPHFRSPDPLGHALHTLRALLEILVVAIFVSTFLFRPARIPTVSMDPTLRAGDMLLADIQAFAPEGVFAPILPATTVHRGDVAIFHAPTRSSTDLVKRIVGLPGDHIQLRNGHVLINARPLAEPYVVFTPSGPDFFRDDFPTLAAIDPAVDPAWWATLRRSTRNGTLTVPPDSFFVLGDNRNNSEDSRYWGFVPRSHLVAKPLFVYLPTLHPEELEGGPLRRLASLVDAIRIVH